MTPDTPTPGGEPSEQHAYLVGLGWQVLAGQLHPLQMASEIMECFGTRPAAEPANPFLKALDIRIEQGWQLGGNACPVLYTDTINGEQVCRDDLWLATTAGLKGAAEPTGFPPRILALLEEVAKGPYEDGQGEPLEADARAALAWLAGQPTTAQADKSAAPAEPATLSGLRGIASGALHGKSSEDVVEASRDDWTAPQAQQEAPDHE